MADAVLYLLQNYDEEAIVNIGWGEDLTIRELAETIMSAIGYTGALTFDHSKPDGTPRKVARCFSLARVLAGVPAFRLQAGIEGTYAWFKDHASGRATLRRIAQSTVIRARAFFPKVFVMCAYIVLFPRGFGTLSRAEGIVVVRG